MGLTLGELISALKECGKQSDGKPKAVQFDFGFTYPNDVFVARGDYSELGIGYGDGYGKINQEQFVNMLEGAIGVEMEAWKGDISVFNKDCHLAVEKCFGDDSMNTVISSVSDEHVIILNTKYEE